MQLRMAPWPSIQSTARGLVRSYEVKVKEYYYYYYLNQELFVPGHQFLRKEMVIPLLRSWQVEKRIKE